jgi:hypothetical protein
MAQNRIKAITLLSKSTADMGELVLVGTLLSPCGFLRFTNNCDSLIAVSYDGTNTHEVVLPNSSIDVYAQNIRQPSNEASFFPVGMPIWGIVSGGEVAGSFSVAGYYQSN